MASLIGGLVKLFVLALKGFLFLMLLPIKLVVWLLKGLAFGKWILLLLAVFGIFRALERRGERFTSNQKVNGE